MKVKNFKPQIPNNKFLIYFRRGRFLINKMKNNTRTLKLTGGLVLFGKKN